MKLPFFPSHDDASFFNFLTRQHPELTPGGGRLPELAPVPHEPARPLQPVSLPHATTVLAIKYQDGVVIAGDRRATERHGGGPLQALQRHVQWHQVDAIGRARKSRCNRTHDAGPQRQPTQRATETGRYAGGPRLRLERKESTGIGDKPLLEPLRLEGTKYHKVLVNLCVLVR